ncbi:hypothetical protein Btru_054253 [Bulinus truncatus]|nr:hypothetical protein Btru_054253 [Bulinus truncatus]
MCSNSGDDTSNDDVFSEDSSESDNDQELKGKRPVFYVNDEPNDEIINGGGGGAAPVNDMIFYNSNAIAMAGLGVDLESLLANNGNNNNNICSNNNNAVLTTEKKKAETESEANKSKLEEDMINKNALTTATTYGKKSSTDRLGCADRLTIDVNGDVIDNRSGIYLGNSSYATSNNDHRSLITSLDAVVKEDNAPPIVVEMWDETEEVRSPTLKSSESIRLPSTSRQASLLVEREERESTPFFFGGNTKDNRCFLEISDKSLDSSTAEQVRVDREPTPFFDDKSTEAKSSGSFLLMPVAIETKFEREPTPFYSHDVADAEVCVATRQCPDKRDSSDAARISNLFQNELPITFPRKSEPELSVIKKDVAIATTTSNNHNESNRRIESSDPKCLARDESGTCSGDIVIVNNNCVLEELHKSPCLGDILKGQQKAHDVENGASRSSGRRSRSETKVSRVVTVEAPAPRALSVPRDTSPTIARGQSGESGRRKALNASQSVPSSAAKAAKAAAMSTQAANPKTNLSPKVTTRTRVSVKVPSNATGTLLTTGKTVTLTKDTTASKAASDKNKKDAKTATVTTAGLVVSAVSSSNASLAKSGDTLQILNVPTQQRTGQITSKKALASPSIPPKTQCSIGEASKPQQNSHVSAPQLKAKSITVQAAEVRDNLIVSAKQERREDDSCKQCLNGDSIQAIRHLDICPSKTSSNDELLQQNKGISLEASTRMTTDESTPAKTKLKLVSRFKKTMKGLLPNTPSDSTTLPNAMSSGNILPSNLSDRKVNKTKTSDSRIPDSEARSLQQDRSFSATPNSESTHTNCGAMNEMSTTRPKESKPRSLLSSFLSSFHKSRSRSDRRPSSDRDGNRMPLFSKDWRATVTSSSRDTPESSQSPLQPPEGARNLRPFSEKSFSRYSPFGSRTTEGLCFLLLMTLFCLYVDMAVEKFVCYVLATFYTFCVLRLIDNTTEDDSTKENTTEDNSTKENTTEDNSTKENITEDNSTKENTTEDNSTKENTTEDNSTKENTTEDNIIFNSVVNRYMTQKKYSYD